MSTNNCVISICTTYNGMFDYFKLKIDLSPFSLLYKVGATSKVMLLELRLLWWIQRSLAACSPIHCGVRVFHLRLWQLAERKDFESDMTLVVMKSVKHLLYFIQETSRWFSPAAVSASWFIPARRQEAPQCWDLPFCSVCKHPGTVKTARA